MSNVLKVDTNTIENIKKNISEIEIFLKEVDNKISQCNTVVELNIETDSINTIKENILNNIDIIKSINNSLTSFSNNVVETNDYITKSLINLRNSYKKINTIK